ncbi:glucose/quinate/shikimate family membrane-bound PQQ-dependent dehydrogenase [Propionivibrio soli]|uniref:glucose/quinate/shikimate family membrane-bound PQQ-dependent dehydrogenase n=1 Tax=Propionivibrio soli TaxID=2976531 RepID=UPI0021E8127C|nr:glucose/quinate/shikimate family membrane-bound PQQ-dependent dehydrogenase [Propionivibrio soli]
MNRTPNRSKLLTLSAALIALMAIAFLGGGAWLVSLGGSWYYVAAGTGLLITASLLFGARPTALWIYAAVILGTFVWSLWEKGLDWWGIAARGDVLFIVGAFLVTPWIIRRLRYASASDFSDAAPLGWDGGRRALGLVLAVYLIVGIVSWFVDPYALRGELPAARSPGVAGAPGPDGLPVPVGEWHAYGRTSEGQRYSPLDQIVPGNAEKLDVAWTFHTGDVRGQPGDPVETTFEVTPLKVGNRLFLCTPHQFVIALDATTGKELWRFDPQIKSGLALQHLTCRGLSFHRRAVEPTAGTTTPLSAGESVPAPTPAAGDCPEKLFMPTADGRLIALNPNDGSLCRRFGGTGQIDLWTGMPNVRPGSYYSTSPVTTTRNVVIVGGTVLDNVSTNEASGVIRGFDVESGQLLWKWDSAHPQETTPLALGQTYAANSPNSWSIMSADEALGLVYIPMGNQPPDQWGAQRSPDVERYSSSVVALEIATGHVRWVFQTVHHDLWDYDVPAQPSLIDLSIGGTTVPALVQATKQGELFVLDRRSGAPLVPVQEVPAPQGAAAGDRTAPTQPVSGVSFNPPPLREADMWGGTPFDQMMCRIAFRRLRYDGRFTPPSTGGSLIYPGNFGVFNWGGIAVDPVRQIAFTTPTYLAFVSQLIPRPDNTTPVVQGSRRPDDSLPALNENFGAPYAVKLHAFTSPFGIPCQAPPWGYVAGVDLADGKIAWKHRNGTVQDLAPIPLPFRMGVPNLGGPIVTRSGVAFLSGTLDYYVRAYDVINGKELWRSRLPAGGQATPMTYMGDDGRQYLLVIAGGHGSLGTKVGDSVIAYALPRT